MFVLDPHARPLVLANWMVKQLSQFQAGVAYTTAAVTDELGSSLHMREQRHVSGQAFTQCLRARLRQMVREGTEERDM